MAAAPQAGQDGQPPTSSGGAPRPGQKTSAGVAWWRPSRRPRPGPGHSHARPHHSGAISAVEPLSILGDIGIALLGIAVVKAGAPRWAAALIAIGAIGEGAGFATGTTVLVIISFALLFAGLVATVRTLVTAPGHWQPAEGAAAAAVVA